MQRACLLLVSLVSLTLPACVNPVAELYDAPNVPQLPALPDVGRIDACQVCAQQKCSVQRAACLEDASCNQLLACRGKCSNPACLQRCTAAHGFSPWYSDLWACVFTDHCAKPCATGENFGCVDDYEAVRAETQAERFSVLLHFKNPRTGLAYAYTGDERDEQFVVGAAARSCLAPVAATTECQVIDSATVGPANTVALDVRAHQVLRYFNGTIEVESNDSSTAAPDFLRQNALHDRYMLPPLAEATEFRLYVFWLSWVRSAVLDTSGATFDVQHAAPLAIYMEDCAGAPARGLRFELPEQPGLQVLHQVSDSSFGDETDTGSALVGDIPDPFRQQAIVIQAVQVKTRKIVAKRNEIYVRPRWMTHVWLSPRPTR
ncbi:MAG TPA: hypothetical protein VF331_20485 [Polyangiales bacterium]